MTTFARPFRVTYLDGGHEEDVHHGVQFPSGRCVIDSPLRGMYLAAVDFDYLNLPPDAEVEWADGGEA